MAAQPGISTTSAPPNTVVQVQPGMNVQPVVLVDQDGNYVTASTASALATTTTPVNVSSATAPTNGQVLTATSGTAAAWQPVSAELPLTTLGDTLYENATPALARLAGNATATKNFLTQTGTGAVSAAPAWGTIAAGDVPTLNQNTSGTAAGLSSALAIGSGGTGQVSQQAAIDALTGTQSAAKVLRSDGTHATLASIQAGDVPTLNQNTSGTAAGLSSALAIGSGGTGQVSAAAAYNALSPMTTTGDIEYESAANTAARLAGNTTGTKNFLISTGSAGSATAPAWGLIAAGDLPAGTTSTKGALQLDGTATDIVALGTQAAGSVGKPADAGHVHPSSALNPSATDQGFKAWVGDPIGFLSPSVAPAAGILYLARIAVQSAVTVTKICTFVATAASGATVQANTYLALFSADGQTQYGVTSDISSSFSTAGLITPSITSSLLTPGYYYVALVIGTVATTTAKIPIFAGAVFFNGYPNMNLTASAARWATQGTGLSAMPSTVTMSSNSLTMGGLNTYFWFALE
jgi:hypothetical protein